MQVVISTTIEHATHLKSGWSPPPGFLTLPVPTHDNGVLLRSPNQINSSIVQWLPPFPTRVIQHPAFRNTLNTTHPVDRCVSRQGECHHFAYI